MAGRPYNPTGQMRLKKTKPLAQRGRDGAELQGHSNSKLVLVTSLTTFLAQDKSKRQQESLVNYLDSCYPDGQVEAGKGKAIEPYL